MNLCKLKHNHIKKHEEETMEENKPTSLAITMVILLCLFQVTLIAFVMSGSLTSFKWEYTLPLFYSWIDYTLPVTFIIALVNSVRIEDDILIVKNQAGDVYWPEFDINNIGNMEVGQGYQINMQSDETLTFPSNSMVLPVLKQFKAQPAEYYTNIEKTTEHMHLALPLEILEDELVYGDELAVYIGEKLVGSAKFANQNLIVTIYGKAELEEQALRFELWQQDSEKQIALHVQTAKQQTLIYQKDAAHRASKLAKVSTGDLLNPEFFSVTNNQLVYLGSTNSESKLSTYKVLDNTGRQVFESKLDLKAEAINLPNLPEGHYFIQLVSETQVTSIKWIKQ